MLINVGDMVDLPVISNNTVGIFSYAFSAVFYFFLAITLRLFWRHQSSKTALWICCLTTSLWSGFIIYGELNTQKHVTYFIQLLEFIKTCGWLYLLARIIGYTSFKEHQDNLYEKRQQQRLIITTFMIAAILFITIMAQPFLPYNSRLIHFNQFILPIGFMILNILGIIFAEQIVRNTPTAERWNVKFFCLSIGIIFAYDFLMYSHAVLYSTIHPALWKARGLIYTLVIPLLIIGVSRDSARPLSLSMSRRFVFRTGTLAAASIYLITISLIGFYFKRVGGTWGELIQTVFIVLGLVALILLMLSGGARARISIWFNQNFFSYRYDYREEWIRFNQILTDTDYGRDISQRALTAMTNIVESIGGILWYMNEQGQFEPVAHQATEDEQQLTHALPQTLIDYWHQEEWVINMDEIQQSSHRYTDLILPDSIKADPRLWLLTPLFLDDTLVGAVFLFKPRANFELNWENYDLLKITGRQICSYLAQDYATRQLAKAQQFAAVNQATAFLVHDVKTMVAQLSLLVKNAARHKENPAFIDDMIKTIDHTANKMNHILAQLKGSHDEKPSAKTFDNEPSNSVLKEDKDNLSTTGTSPITHLLERLLEHHQNDAPKPVVRFFSGDSTKPDLIITDSAAISTVLNTAEQSFCYLSRLHVTLDNETLYSALNHLIQNSKEATPPDGHIFLDIHRPINGYLRLDVVDNGHGMTPEFIKNKLFHPFESTKGLTGMGIGAYQSREYIQNSGGKLTVHSEPGRGSQFTIQLKIAQ